VNCGLFRRGIREPAIEEEQNDLQYPPTSRALSISSPTNAAPAAGYPDISPRCSTVAPMNPIFRLFGYRRPPHRFLEITICDLKSR
jgi:hypothetical protein